MLKWMKVENSPQFEAEMEAHRKKRERERLKAEKLKAAAVAKGLGLSWTPMDKCPFEALDLWSGSHDYILITDGKSVTVTRITERFGTPVFYKKEPERVFRDGMLWMEGGEVDPRPDLPKWWWKWELKDELESEVTYYESSSKPEVDWTPTHWMWMPKPPAL